MVGAWLTPHCHVSLAQCRRRWINSLNMASKKETAWTEEEDQQLVGRWG